MKQQKEPKNWRFTREILFAGIVYLLSGCFFIVGPLMLAPVNYSWRTKGSAEIIYTRENSPFEFWAQFWTHIGLGLLFLGSRFSP